ncbi:hypothetical protein HY311_00630 [Candidatus Nomurabacteria bacterium]|nr:hypothetical protein [Candidatus Nomurabacteria bacterium]
MNINIKFFKRENSFKKKDFKLDSGFYWKIFLGITFMMILFAFYFGYNLFAHINEEFVLSNGGGNSQSKMIDKNRIDKVLNFFSIREENSNRIMSSPAPVVDPSL